MNKMLREENMKLYDTSLKYMDAINAVGGTIVAVLTAALGTHWFLFVGFLTLNIIDYITGIRKSRLTGKENSAKECVEFGKNSATGSWC